MNHNEADPRTGLVGIMAAVTGVMGSHLEQIEIWLRVMTTAVGLFVALLTAITLLRGLRQRQQQRIKPHRPLRVQPMAMDAS